MTEQGQREGRELKIRLEAGSPGGRRPKTATRPIAHSRLRVGDAGPAPHSRLAQLRCGPDFELRAWAFLHLQDGLRDRFCPGPSVRHLRSPDPPSTALHTHTRPLACRLA